MGLLALDRSHPQETKRLTGKTVSLEFVAKD